MSRKRRQHGREFKAQVALAALKEQQTIQELAKRFAIHTSQIQDWKKRLVEGASDIFASAHEKAAAGDEPSMAELYQEIGRLKVQLEWLKKKLPCSPDRLRALIDSAHEELSVSMQCALIGLPRSSLYYEAVPETAENLKLRHTGRPHAKQYAQPGRTRNTFLIFSAPLRFKILKRGGAEKRKEPKPHSSAATRAGSSG